MPNWCANDLYIEGPTDKVAECVAFIGERFDFDKLIPYPEKFKQMDEEAAAFSFFDGKGTKEEQAIAREAYIAKWGTASDGFNSGGYEWCVTNWDTKWNNPDVTSYLHPVRGQCLTFDTAWSPPTAVIKALAAKFPELSLCHEYFEQGAAFCGGVTYPSLEQLNDGDEIREWSGDYNGPRGG